MPLRRDPSLIPLSHDHHHGLVRVFEIRQALRRDGDLGEQAGLTLAFCRADLRPHFRAEEDVVFPAIARHAGAAETSALIAEHRRLEEIAADLERDPSRLADFADLLERHIRAEERTLFPLYQERVPDEERAAIERAVRRVLNRPHDVAAACALPRR